MGSLCVSHIVKDESLSKEEIRQLKDLIEKMEQDQNPSTLPSTENGKPPISEDKRGLSRFGGGATSPQEF